MSQTRESFAKGNKAACKFKKRYIKEIIEFFSQPNTRVETLEELDGEGKVTKRISKTVVNEYPTFEAFAARVGVTTKTLRAWREQDSAFDDAYERAKELQKYKLIVNALGGYYNPMFAKFEAINNHGMREHDDRGRSGDDTEISVSFEREGETKQWAE